MSKGKQLAQEHKEKGNKAFQSEKYAESISWYTQAIQADPTDHVLYSNRSAAYIGSKEFAKALADADKCISIKSNWGKGYYRKAATLLQLNRTSEAVDVLNKGLTQEPNNADILKKLEEAKLINKKSGGKTKAVGLDAKAEGNAHFKESRYEQAISSYAVALETIEDVNERATLFSNKAACYYQLRAYDEVVADATESLTLVPNFTKSLLRRGLAYESLEKSKLALIDLQQVTQQEPGTPLAATASAAVHRIKQAQARFERAGK